MMRGAINIKWFNKYLTINTDLKGRRKIWERGEIPLRENLNILSFQFPLSLPFPFLH